MHSAQQHRHFYLLIGSAEQRIRAFHALTQALVSPFITTLTPADFSAAALAAELSLPCRAFNSLDLQLGHTSEAILFDLQQGLSANSLAIAAGTVCGGGLLALGLDDLTAWQEATDGDLARHLPWPLTPEQQSSPFKGYFTQHLQTDAIKILDASLSADIPPLAKIPDSSATNIQFTAEQQSLISDITGFFNRDIFPTTSILSPITNTLSSPISSKVLTLIAHRGRGKSSVLGVALAQLIHAGLKVKVTAPRRSAVDTLAYHFALSADVDAKTLPFCAPDELLQQPLPLDLLIVDEAAALPLPMLEQLSQHYPNILFSSTDHGYEGGGKGFGIRFVDSLKRAHVTLQQYTLETPVRWRAGDPLEHWLDTLLLLYPTKYAVSEATITMSYQPQPPQTLQAMQGADWLNQPALLQQSFSLLVSAHYQTSPNDLRWIMDDPSVTCWIYRAKAQSAANPPLTSHPQTIEAPLSAIAVVTQEGPIEPNMALEVLAGRRRPRGHLLPQSLLAHEGWLDAAEYRFWRVSRIATTIEQQRQGHATELLSQLANEAKGQAVDFLCCSFAATLEVVQFWQKNGFHAVRLGTSRDQASGCYSLMMVKALNPQAHRQAALWQQAYGDNLLLKLLLGYADLPTELALVLCRQAHPQPPLATDLAAIKLFVHQHRPYSSIQAQLTRCVFALAQQGTLQPNTLSHLRLFQAALGQINEKQHPYDSRRAFLNDIKTSLKTLLPT